MTESRIGMRMPVDAFRQAFDRGDLIGCDRSRYSVEAPPLIDVDPRSEEYHAVVMATWQSLTSRSGYAAESDEAFDLDGDFLAHPYPHRTGDPYLTGCYLGAISWFLRHLTPTPPSHVVELGAGWGHLALNLAMLGYRTTAVDLNVASTDLLRARAARWALDLSIDRSSFLDCEIPTDTAAIVFFESFHHCERPFELLDSCAAALAPGGQLYFLADAIYDDFYAPWGVRLDGDAAFAARAHGWLELGFRKDFFVDELLRRNFDVRWEVDAAYGAYGTLLTGTRRDRVVMPNRTLLPIHQESSWTATDARLDGRFAREASMITLPDGAERGSVNVVLDNVTDGPLRVECDVDPHASSVPIFLNPGERQTVDVAAPIGSRVLTVRSDLAPCGIVPSGRAGVYVAEITLR